MKFSIVIPAHNEAKVILKTLNSLAQQTVIPNELIVVNDNSTDNTADLVNTFCKKHKWCTLVNIKSEAKHLPGAKIINAFYNGYKTLTKNYDVICKFDADLIFPSNYLETLEKHYNLNPKLGLVAGFCYIEKNNSWVLENLTNKDHIRGALKAYRAECFKDIGQLKNTMGWDTIDELLAKYYQWELLTDESLHVKHLKPTGSSYNPSAKYLQGEAMYKMRYGLPLTIITAIKLSLKKKSLRYFINYIIGYLKAMKNKTQQVVTKEQGDFIRAYRWKGIKKKFL